MSIHSTLTRRAATTRLAALAGGALGLGTVPLASLGQGIYPERPITLIAPFGGAVDILARLIALQLAKNLNGNVIVDVKLGGSGTIGMAALARAAPDGYTIGMGTSTSLTSAPHLIKNPGYDVGKSFTYLGLIQTSRQVMVVSPQLGVNTVQEFIALAKSKPGEFNFGSSGVGNSIHLVAEEFNAGAGIKAVHIPYKTGPETDAAIMAGSVQYAFSSLPTSIALIQAGRLKALAVTGDTRDPSLPNVMSIKEAGFPALLPEQLFGMAAPANLPPAVLARLNKAIQDMTADPAFQDSIRRGGAAPSQMGGEEFRKVVLRDSQLWADLIKRLGITLN
jgi:tripartite-type tricarboxylate transporter receptor subunit TctC